MAKRSEKSADEKAAAVLAVLRREITAVDAARSHGVSEQTIHNWKAAFLAGGREHLARGPGTGGRTAREGAAREEERDDGTAERLRELEAENRTLRESLALAEVELLVSGRGREPLPPSPTSR